MANANITTKLNPGDYVKETIDSGIFAETRYGRVIRGGIRDFYGIGELTPIVKVDFGSNYGVIWVDKKNLRRSTKADFERFA